MRTFSVAGLVLLTAMVGGAPTRAQNSLTGTVIAGPTAADVHGSPLVTGRRVQSSASSPTEIAFSDGTSIVLGPGADVTIKSVTRDEAGRWVLTGSSDRGTLRILAADKTSVALHTPAGDLRLAGTSVVVQGGTNGSVTLLSAGKVEVRHDGRTDVLERAGFRLPFSGGGFERAAAPQMATTVNQFAPVEKPVGTVGRPPQQIACPPGLSQRGGRRGSDQTDASCVVSKAAYVPSQDQTITYNKAAYVPSQDQTITYNSNQSVTQGLQSEIGGRQTQAQRSAQTANSSGSGEPQSVPFALDGFATGIVQSTSGGQTSLYAVSSTHPGDVHIASNPSNTEFAATFGFQPTAVGNLSFDVGAAPAPNGASGRKSLNFGNAPGPIPTTAVISTSTFAGVVPASATKPGGAAVASVDSDTIQGVASRTGTIAAPGGPTVDASLPPSNEHLAWGFFLGDLAVQAAGQQRDYVGMGFWVAGRPMSLQALQALTGTATYAGGMVGTVAQQAGAQAQLRTVTGQFAEKWNFATRTGSMNASFDGGNWNGVAVAMAPGRTDFGGADVSDNLRIMTVQGTFFHNAPTVQMPATPLSAPNTPATVGGLFGIRAAGYGANGIFVGGRR